MQLTLETIGKYFASFEPGPKMDTLSELYVGFMKGRRAYPFKFPESTYYKALQVSLLISATKKHILRKMPISSR